MDLSEPKQPGTSPADHERGPSDAAVRLSGSSTRIGCGWTGARVRRIRDCAPGAVQEPIGGVGSASSTWLDLLGYPLAYHG